MHNKNTFICTIGYNCGLILEKCLDSYFKFHDNTVNVFGTPKDFKTLTKKDYVNKIEFHDLSIDNNVEQMYKQGHLGTAYILAKIISDSYRQEKNIIHFDSDIIFRENCIDDIQSKFDEGYDLIGPRRAYKHNIANKNGQYDKVEDVISTYIMGFNKTKISKLDFSKLVSMVVGFLNPLGFNVIDFFDPISFDILNNGGKIHYLDHELYGSMNEEGSKKNSFGELNIIMDFGKKIMHFAGVGSGLNFYHNGHGDVPRIYSDWAVERYALYVKLFHNKDIDIKYNEDNYNLINKILHEQN